MKGLISTMVLALFVVGCAPPQPGVHDTPVVITDEQTDQKTDSVTIRFGSSHGMCLGYCRQEFELHPTTLDGQRFAGGRGADSTKYPTQRQVFNLSGGQYEQVIMSLDSAARWSGPDTIGCPDCADGGACWMELAKGGRKRRMVFDCSGGAGPHDHLAHLLWGLADSVEWPEAPAPQQRKE